MERNEGHSYLNQLNANVPKEWIHALALPTQVSIKTSGVNYQHGFVLFKTLVDLLAKISVFFLPF